MAFEKALAFLVFVFVFCLCPFNSYAAVVDSNTLQKLYFLKIEVLTAKKSELADLNYNLDRTRKAPASYFPEKGSRRIAITDLEKKMADVNHTIARIEANDFNLIVPVFSKGHKIGEIGRFGEYTLNNGIHSFPNPQYCKIINIMDSKNALVDFMYRTAYTKFTQPIGFGYGKPQEYYETIWLKGIDLSGRVTGSNILPKGVFIVSGTADYMTSENSKLTVFVFEPIDSLQ